MITLKTADLRSVQKKFQSIRQRNILPILNFIKIECDGKQATITKDNLDIFIIQTMPCTGSDKLLVYEDSFWNFINFATTQSIDINIKGNEYSLVSGQTILKNTTEDIKKFPSQRKIPNDDGITIDTNYFVGLSSIIIEEEIPTQRGFIFINEGTASGSDGYIGYCVPLSGVNKVVFKKEILSKLPHGEFKYISSENNDFFISENVIFGFVKPEISFSNISSFFKPPSEPGFMVDKTQLLKFSDMALSSSQSKATIITFEVLMNKMSLRMHDEISNNTATSVLDVTGEGSEFSYVAEQMSRLLKAIPYDSLEFIPSENKYYIKAPDGSIGLIMGAAIN